MRRRRTPPSNFGCEALFATLLLYAFRSREEIHSEMRIDMRSGGCGTCPPGNALSQVE
jgi:hypothetical protein